MEEILGTSCKGTKNLSDKIENNTEINKNKVGRPIGIPSTPFQREAVSRAAKEYHRKLKKSCRLQKTK